MPIDFQPEGGGGGIDFMPEAPSSVSFSKRTAPAATGPQISPAPMDIRSRAERYLAQQFPRLFGQGTQLQPTTVLQDFAAPPSAIQQMQPSVGKALGEQLTLPNIALGAVLPGYIAAAKTSIPARAILAGLLTKFGIEGAQSAGTEFGTASGIPVPHRVFGNPVAGALSPEETPAQKEQEYHIALGLLGLAQALPVVGARKFGEAMLGRLTELTSQDVNANITPQDRVEGGRSFMNIDFTPEDISAARQGAVQGEPEAFRTKPQYEAPQPAPITMPFIRNVQVEQPKEIVQQSVATKAPVEEAGGKVSFAAPAEAQGIPSARQSTIQQLHSGVAPLAPEELRDYNWLLGVSRQGQLQSQERARLNDYQTRMATQYEPALMINGQPVTGGETHADILKNFIREHPDQGGAAIDAFQNDASHVFTGPEGTLSREGLQQKLGYSRPMHSQDLRVLQQEARSKYAKDVRGNQRQFETQGLSGQGRQADSGGDIQQAAGKEEAPAVRESEQQVMQLHSGLSWDEVKKMVGVEGSFMSGAAKEALLGSGVKTPDTQIDSQQLWNRMRNKLGAQSAEVKLLEDAGIGKEVQSGKMTSPVEFAKKVQELSPKVEVRSYGAEGKVSEAAKELGRMQHEWYANITQDERNAVADARQYNPQGQDLRLRKAFWRNEEGYKQAQKYLQLEKQVEAEQGKPDTTPKMTGQQVGAYKHVSPKSTEEPMPEWTTSKSGKNVQRVDVVVPSKGHNLITPNGVVNTKTLWQPDSLHEQHPNTLGWAAIQYETGPKGEKIAHIFEVQSRWGQEHREAIKGGYAVPDRRAQDHPLLRDYNRLILKAAIEQARKEGATHIAISDAETAMMSEGHDTMAGQAQPDNAGGIVRVGNNISQEPGMRLNYDKILPTIASELTGSKGEKVSLGEHKNAYEQQPDFGGVQPTGYEGPPMGSPRQNLIFRNPDGTPKTDVTATMYPLGKAGERLATGEPMTTMQKMYSGVEIPKEAQDAINRVLGIVKEGNFPRVDTLPDKPQKQVAPLEVFKAMQTAESKPFEDNPVFRPQPGEKVTMLEKVFAAKDKAVNTLAKIDKYILPIDAWMDMLDGGHGRYDGWLMKNVRGPIENQANYELQLRQSVIRPVVDMVKKYKLNKQNAERIGVYAHAMQEGGVKRMLDSGVTQATIDKILKDITPQEKQVYQTMRQMMDNTLPAIQSVMKELYGENVKPVQNYFPMPRDYDKFQPEPDSIAKGTFDDRGMWKLLQGDFEPRGTKTEQGFTVARKPGAKTAIKINAFDVYQQHMTDVAHLVAMQKQLYKIGQVARSDAFKQKYGELGQDMILDWLNTVARQGRTGKRLWFLDTLRKNTSTGVIAFRLASQLVHSSNIPLAIQRTGVKNWYKGLSDALSEDGEAFLRQHFAETFERGGGEPALVEASRGKISSAGFAIQRLIDRLNTQATVLGVYAGELAKKGQSDYLTAPLDAEARNRALILARRAVASPLYKDIPLALTRGGSFGRLFFQFQNTFLDQWSNIRHDFAGAGIKQMNPALASQMAVALTAMLMIEAGIKFGVKQGVNVATDNETEGSDKFWEKVGEDLVKRIPGMGQIMSIYQYGQSGVPAAGVMGQMLHGTYQATTGKDRPSDKQSSDYLRERGIVDAASAALELAGVPGTSQVSEIVKAKMKSERKKEQEEKKKSKKRYSIY